MKPSTLKSFLSRAIRNKRRVLVKGPPGGGKSDIVAAACHDTKHKLIIFHPAISDPVDYSGLPGLVEGKAEFLPFGQLRKLIEANEPTVAFLDDIGQAAVSVQAALMQLILARRVNGHTISDKVVFVGATNNTKDHAGVSGLIEPVKSRWNSIVELEVSVDDWSNWALDENHPVEIIAFLRARPDLLSDFKPTKEITNSPCPRNWASVCNWYADGERDLEVFAGAIGKGAATELVAYLQMVNDLPDPADILLHPDTALVPPNDKPALQYAAVCGIANRVSETNFEAGLTYSARIGRKAFEVLYVKDAVRRCAKIKTTKAFIRWGSQKENVEAVL